MRDTALGRHTNKQITDIRAPPALFTYSSASLLHECHFLFSRQEEQKTGSLNRMQRLSLSRSFYAGFRWSSNMISLTHLFQVSAHQIKRSLSLSLSLPIPSFYHSDCHACIADWKRRNQVNYWMPSHTQSLPVCLRPSRLACYVRVGHSLSSLNIPHSWFQH